MPELEEPTVQPSSFDDLQRETLAEAIPNLVWTTLPDGSVDYVNQRCIEYFGTRSLDWSWTVHVEPSDLPPLLERWRDALERGVPYEIECRFRRWDGVFRWFLMQALPVRCGARVVRWFGTGTDIHDRKLLAEERERLLERAREDLRARDVFLAIAAHELRTPLTPLRLEIEGLARAASHGKLTTERAAERLPRAERQIARLERLVANLLDVSRLASGGFALSREELDLSTLVHDLAARHAGDLASAGCALRLDAPGPVRGTWDRLRVDQAVTNLLFNALTYGRGKPVTLALSATDASARIEVRDEGEGIAPEDHARIFQRFERATADRQAGGLGLGLWLAREIAEAHGGSVGGSVSVESRRGEGARFVVTLPRA
jgi:PAS domain S-box-containing protein